MGLVVYQKIVVLSVCAPDKFAEAPLWQAYWSDIGDNAIVVGIQSIGGHWMLGKCMIATGRQLIFEN
jgi:hypothetical protein